MIRVVLADDQELVRAGFRLLLDTLPDVQVVGEAGDGAEAVEVVAQTRPDVILMDIRMPVMDGIEATRRITATDVASRVLVLTTFDLDEYVHDALIAGASGFLLKDSAPADLIRAVRIVHEGEALLAPAATRRLIQQFVLQSSRPQGGRRPGRSLPNDLTPRETEVLELVARGLSNQEICDHLVVSMATVKTHIGRLLAKCAARDRAQLVVLAYEAGLVAPGT